MKTPLITLLILIISIAEIDAQYVPVPVNSTRSLNGTWKFNPSPDNHTFSTNQFQSSWKDIAVPGEWTMQGFEVKKGSRAAYQTRFEFPSDWKGKRVFIRFDAVYSDAIVWVNGARACSHTGGFNVFECDITGLLKKGSNLLTVGVMNESIADTLSCGSQYAAHPLGGIPRKVTLFCLPELYLSDLYIKTVFDADYVNATLQLDADILSTAKSSPEATLQIELIGPDGKLTKTITGNILPALPEKHHISLNLNIEKPRKWNAEYPDLYLLRLKLSSVAGTEIIEKKIGFRQLEVAGNQLFLNGTPIKLHGVDRHEVHPLYGRSLNMDLWKQDAQLYKEANVNYIRTSHYPPAEEFIDLCDSIGLYVELENPLVWIGHDANLSLKFQEAWNLRLRKELIKTTKETITFYRNHPGIIIWSLANESAWTDNWSKTKEAADSIDPTRPKSFHDQAYGEYNNYGSVAMQVANVHYPGPRGPEIADTFARPLLFGEYCHLNTYNRQENATDPGVRDAWGAGFNRMWEKMFRAKGCLGGAIWSGIDDAFMLPGGKLVGYGEWGPIDGWRRKKPEYYHIMKTYSPVIINCRKTDLNGKNELLIPVENRFDFTDLKECRFEWEIAGEKGIAAVSAAPHNSALLRIGPFNGCVSDKMLKIKVFSPYNRLIDETLIEVGKVENDSFPFRSVNGKTIAKSENVSHIILSSGDAVWIFDKTSGKLASALYRGDTILSGGAELMVLPLHSEECKTEHSLRIPVMNNTCADWKLLSVNTSQSGDTVKISVTGDYKEADASITYCFINGNELFVRYSFVASEDINPRQVGLVFTVPGSQKNLDWFRKGFWSSYPDWHIGRTTGHAIPFPAEAFYPGMPWKKPATEWRFDANALGTNDFRSTKANIFKASLTGSEGTGIAAFSDGRHAFRSWADGNSIRFLVADYSNGGAEIFFASHLESERRPLHKGDKFEGRIELRMVEKK